MTESKRIDEGGQAFPESGVWDGDRNTVNPVGAYFDAGGMTLRDYIATNVDCGELEELNAKSAEVLAGRAIPDGEYFSHEKMRFWADARAAYRYMEADAMIRARKKCYD